MTTTNWSDSKLCDEINYFIARTDYHSKFVKKRTDVVLASPEREVFLSSIAKYIRANSLTEEFSELYAVIRVENEDVSSRYTENENIEFMLHSVKHDVRFMKNVMVVEHLIGGIIVGIILLSMF